jgi:hypothetical protein
MAVNVKPEAAPKKGASKQKRNTTTKGNSKKATAAKSSAKFTLVSTRDEALNVPVGEVMNRIDFDSKDVVLANMKVHVPSKGAHKGQKTLQLLVPDANGANHAIYEGAVALLGGWFERDPLAYLQVIDGARAIAARNAGKNN